MASHPIDLRSYIDLIEAQQRDWSVWRSPIFQETLKEHLRVFPDLVDKLEKFLHTKLPNPMSPDARYGKHDGPMTPPLNGFYHCHLRDDAILVYKLKGSELRLVAIVSHAEIEGKRLKKTKKRLEDFL